ncbi:MAG: response regulator [Anaerolineales bacterium]|nr:response regulator [Anaerolineales bacterium]
MEKKTWLLLVDDSIEYSQMVQTLLQLESAYGVDWANSLEKMWQKLEEKDYAVILLDNHLPDGSGLATLPELASRDKRPPVIMITGAGDEKTASEAIKLGAYDYLSKGKPELIELSHVVDRVIRMHADIMKKTEAEEKLRYHALLLERLSDAIIVINSAEEISFWNEGAERIFGKAARNVLGEPIRLVLTDNPNLHAFLEGPKEGIETDTFELPLQDGKMAYVSVNSTSVHIPDQAAPGCILVFRDITPYRVLQEELRKTQMRLLDAARVASIGELASSMAHKIHNPLTTVLGEAQILTRNLEAESVEGQSAQAIEEAGWRAAKVIKNLMRVTAATTSDQGQYELSPTIFSAIDLTRVVVEENRIRLEMSIEAGLPLVSVRERDLIDLWFHLLHLAVQCSKDTSEPWIKLAAYLHEQTITVKIQCSGNIPELSSEQEGAGFSQELVGMTIVEGIIQKYDKKLDIAIRSAAPSEIVVCMDEGSGTE